MQSVRVYAAPLQFSMARIWPLIDRRDACAVNRHWTSAGGTLARKLGQLRRECSRHYQGADGTVVLRPTCYEAQR
jgi:hypothetical protein